MSDIDIDFDLKQLDDLDKTLERLGDRITRNASASALRAAGRVIINDAKGRLPGNYKSLSKSLATKVLRPKDLYNRVAVVGPRDNGKSKHNPGIYGVMVEFGTLASRTKSLAKGTRRKLNYNPLPEGLKPISFMTPAVDTTYRLQINAMATQMKAYLNKRGLL